MRSVLFTLSLLWLALADQNTTIDDTDVSIQYSGGGHTSPCLFSADGTFLPGQPGCFNNGPKNCSSGAHILQEHNSTLSMLFKGSAIYMNALLDDISNTYTVTLDGKSTDIDGVRPGGALLCHTLFSQSDLDPTVEHNISLSIKDVSPTRNTTLGNANGFFFWLDNFVVTTPDASSSAGSSSGGSSATASTSSPSTTPSAGASIPLAVASPWIFLGATFLSLFHL
ncbi:hypothetical protein C8R43DRAFT_1107362 [Mycena crocata]|nr:hypothetical protein C8R43DRAFT_1107362 [Mycena crocata]